MGKTAVKGLFHLILIEMCIRDRYQYIGMLLLDSLCQLAQHTRTADACHILQTDFGCSRLNELVGNVCIDVYKRQPRCACTRSARKYTTH